MQAQHFAPESNRNNTLEKIESRVLSPQETAKEMMRDADRQITSVKSGIETARAEVAQDGDAAMKAELKQMEDELDDAWGELQAEVAEATIPAPLESGIVESKKQKEEELDWEIPEELEVATAEIQPFTSAEAVEAITSQEKPFEAISGNIEAMNQEQRAELAAALTEEVGPQFAQRFVESAEYRKQLTELSSALSKNLPKGPVLLKDRNLKNIMTIQEVLGSKAHELAEAMDLASYIDDLKRHDSESALRVEFVSFDEQGKMNGAKISFEQHYDSAETENSEVTRSFELIPTIDAEGKEKILKRVNHEVLSIPTEGKSNGIAARITQESLKHYDEMKADEVALKANIDIGGYAWASYGYGWDHETIGRTSYIKHEAEQATVSIDRNAFDQDLAKKKPNLDERGRQLEFNSYKSIVKSKAEVTANKKYDAMPQAGRLEQFSQAVSELTLRVHEKYRKAAESAQAINDPRVQEHLKKIEALSKDGSSVTPQILAALGKDAPRFVQSKSGRWYTEDAFQTAVADGEAEADPESIGPMHAGKIGLIGSSWNGKIELQAGGSQGGVNRSLLEKTLSRRTSTV